MIWDWNGTLLDDVELVVDIMNGLLAPRELPALDVPRYREIFMFPVQDYYERLGFDFEREPFEELAVEFMSGFIARWPEADLRAGARESIDALAARGVGQSLLSAAQSELLHDATTHFGLAEVMSHRVGIGDHHAVSKVEEGRAHVAELTAERVILIGDTEHDAEVAEEIGVDCVLVEGGHMSRERLLATGVPVFDSFEALRERLGVSG